MAGSANGCRFCTFMQEGVEGGLARADGVGGGQAGEVGLGWHPLPSVLPSTLPQLVTSMAAAHCMQAQQAGHSLQLCLATRQPQDI